MRFVGFKEDGSGELKRASPGGFKQHELRELPFDYSLEPYWEIVDNIPDLVVPEEDPEDSVYEEDGGTYVDEKTDMPFKFKLPIEGDPEEVDVIQYDGMTVKSLRLFIEQRGGKVDRTWRKSDLVLEAQRLEDARRATYHVRAHPPEEADTPPDETKETPE